MKKITVDIKCSFKKTEDYIDPVIKRVVFFIRAVIFTQLLIPGCRKLVEVDPPIQDIIGQEIYRTNDNAASVLTGIYTDMSNYGIFTGKNSISLKTGLSGDELVSNTPPSDILSIIYRNSLTNNGDELFWGDLYGYIFRINAAIEGLTTSSGLSPEIKQRLIGEAKFLRAFMYFYLVNLYGEVPLLLSTDIKTNSVASRDGKDKIYTQIINDLLAAKTALSMEYLSSDIVTPSLERLRPNRAVASAFLARVYLYLGRWELAEEESSNLINNTEQYSLESINNVFLAVSREAIWQLQPVAVAQNTLDALTFVLSAGQGLPAGPNGNARPVYLARSLYGDFEDNDLRKINWIDSVTVNNVTYPFAYKYKVWMSGQMKTEYLMVIRLAEMYLIRAEARVQLGKITGANSAEEDINAIRKRAGLGATSAKTQQEMFNSILKERRVELFTEWGHRWLDLKRVGKIDDVMNVVTPQKGGSWTKYKALFPIPVQDIQRNPNLKGHQNPGYPEL